MGRILAELSGILPLVSLLLGGLLQYTFTRAAEGRKQLELLRNQAYVDYLRSVARLAHGRTAQEVADAKQAAADAKARIAIYGTEHAIAALARFEESGANLGTDQAMQRFVDVAVSMRGGDASRSDLKLVLFGPEPPRSQT